MTFQIKDLVHKEPLKEQDENDGDIKREVCESSVAEGVKLQTTSSLTTASSVMSTTSSLNTATPTTSANQDRLYTHASNQNRCNTENMVPTTPSTQQNNISAITSPVTSSVYSNKVNIMPQAAPGGFLQIRPSANQPQGLRPTGPVTKDNGFLPTTVLRQPMTNIRHNLIGAPEFRLSKTSIAAVLPQPPTAHNNVRILLPPAPDADTSMLKNVFKKLPPAHVHRKVSLLTEPIHGAQAHKLLYAATQTTKPKRPFLNPAPAVRNPTLTGSIYGPLDIFPNSKLNEVNKLQISRQPGEAASKYMNLATPPPAHCNPVKSSSSLNCNGGGRLNNSAKKRPLTVPPRQNSMVVNNIIVRPGATEVKRPRLVSDFLTLANAPPKNPFVNNSVIQSGPSLAHKNNITSSNINNINIRPPNGGLVGGTGISHQQQQQQTRTVIQAVPSAHSNYPTSGGAMTVTSASWAGGNGDRGLQIGGGALRAGATAGGSPLDFSKKSLNFAGVVGTRTIRGVGIGGLESSSPVIISPPLTKEEPVNLTIKRPVSLSTSQNFSQSLPQTPLFPALSPVIAAPPGTLIPMVAMPTNMVTTATTANNSLVRPVVSVVGNVISSGEKPGPGGDAGKVQVCVK